MRCQPPIDMTALSRGLYSQGAEEAMLDRVFELVAPRRRFCRRKALPWARGHRRG